MRVKSKMYDNWDGFNFEIVNFSFLDGDVFRSLFDLREYILMLVTSTTETNW